MDALRGMNEGQARDLAKLPHEKRVAALEAAATIANNKKLTAKDIRKAAEKVSPESVKPKPTATQPDDLVRHPPMRKLDRSRLPTGPKLKNVLQARENDILQAMNDIFIRRLWRKAGFNSFTEYVGDFQGRLLATYAEFIVNNDEEDYKG